MLGVLKNLAFWVVFGNSSWYFLGYTFAQIGIDIKFGIESLIGVLSLLGVDKFISKMRAVENVSCNAVAYLILGI